jgi:hypothetical protein
MNRRERKMFDTAPQREKLLEHLNSALTIAGAIEEPMLEYLIERAIDEARSTQFVDEQKNY